MPINSYGVNKTSILFWRYVLLYCTSSKKVPLLINLQSWQHPRFLVLCKPNRCASWASSGADWDTAASAACQSARQPVCHVSVSLGQAGGSVLSVWEGGPWGQRGCPSTGPRGKDAEEDEWITERRRVVLWQRDEGGDTRISDVTL